MINTVHSENLAVRHFEEVLGREQAVRENLERWQLDRRRRLGRSGPSAGGPGHDGTYHA
jgi:hypothetical protein